MLCHRELLRLRKTLRFTQACRCPRGT